MPLEKAFRNDFDNILVHDEPKTKLPSEKLLLSNPMLWNLIQLYRKNESHPPTFHLAFIDYLMCEDAKNQKSRISPLLATHMSSMITVDDILSSLRYHRPQQGASVDEKMLARFGAEQPRTLPAREQSALGRIDGLKDAMWPKLQIFLELPLPPSEEPAVLLKHLRPLDEASHEFWRWAHVAFALAIKHSDRPEQELYSNLWYLTMIGTAKMERQRTALSYAKLEQAANEQGETFLVAERIAMLIRRQSVASECRPPNHPRQRRSLVYHCRLHGASQQHHLLYRSPGQRPRRRRGHQNLLPPHLTIRNAKLNWLPPLRTRRRAQSWCPQRA